ncbi:calcium homeostasis protein Regucalcin [Aspergillus pseudoustus]|uniref:Calcium homeostasis protein Regucalcin n=1 Tax=Aspergillus pseudoustus TaxID=1810923 RepID=A0ABR4JVN0_9EURO
MPEIKTWKIEKPWVHMRCALGEGPFYNEETNEVRWLDITERKIHFVNASVGPSSLRTITTDHLIGVTADVDGAPKKLVAAAKEGFAWIDRETGKMEWIARIYEAEGAETVRTRMRMNDGAVDSKGRLWAGGMQDTLVVPGFPGPVGSLWRLDPDGSAHKMIDGGIAVTNGIAWNCADTVMYHTDSGPNNIYAYEFDAENGEISNGHVFFHWEEKIKGEVGLLDGLVADEDDCLWSAIYWGYKVIRISPSGQHIGTIELPAPCISAVVFMGTELAITSASNREKVPTEYGGNLFRIDVGVRGRQRYKFKSSIAI